MGLPLGAGLPPGGAPPPGAGNPLATVLGALQNRAMTPGRSAAEQSADLQGADPTMSLRRLELINQLLGLEFVRNFQTAPNLANAISSTMKQLSRAIKEAQQGASVGEVVGKAEQGTQTPPPITFGPAQIGQPPGGEGGMATPA